MPSQFARRIGRAKRLNSPVYFNYMRRAAYECANDVARMYRWTTDTWKDSPRFGIISDDVINFDSARIDFTVYAIDPINENDRIADIYRFIDYGTNIRWAVMTADWISKTKPDYLGSSKGRGIPWLRGRKQMMEAGIEEPMNGIEPRNFSSMIFEEYLPTFKYKMSKANKEAFDLAKGFGEL